MALGIATIVHALEPDHFDALIVRAVQKAVEKEFEKERRERKAADVPELLNRKEAAAFLGVSASTIDGWAKAGRLAKHKAGVTCRFQKSELLGLFSTLKKHQR